MLREKLRRYYDVLAVVSSTLSAQLARCTVGGVYYMREEG
jgi:hypothetical protein